jgi:multiple sugar transport system permease protein
MRVRVDVLTKGRVVSAPRFSLRTREHLVGYLFILPGILGFLIFSLGPLIAALLMSFTDYNMIEKAHWVGLANYSRAFHADPLFWPSIKRTVIYALLDVPIGIALSLGVAVLLNQRLRGTWLFRTLFFLPSVVPTVVAVLFWVWLLNPDFGLMNYLLRQLGLTGPTWLSSSRWALPSLVFMDWWSTVGGTRMIIFLAALQGVPQDLLDAASLDGASPGRRFFGITLPLITPSVFFVTILTVITSLRVFTPAYIATEGGPSYATWFYGFHMFKTAFQFFEMGYASALGWLFFLAILVLTVCQFSLQNRWVHYEGGR